MKHRSRIISFSGIWDLGMALSLCFPALYKFMGLRLEDPVWGYVMAGFLFFTGMTLLVAGRDLDRFAGIVLLNSVHRFIAAAIFVYAGVFSAHGVMATLVGATDGLWGVFYLIHLPKRLGRSIREIIADL